MPKTFNAEPPVQQGYRAPYAEVGMSVLWYPDGDTSHTPHPGFITAVGHDTVCLNIMAPNSYNFMVRDGVRHITDPRTHPVERREAGTWEFTPHTERMLNLINDFTEFMRKQPL